MVKFLGLVKKIKNYLTSIFSQRLNYTTREYFRYENILFRTYFDIASTGNFELLIVGDNKRNINNEELINAWEEIVKRDDEVKGGQKYNRQLNLHKSYAKLYQTYLLVKTCLYQLLCLESGSAEAVAIVGELRGQGYNVDVNNYYPSIVANLQSSNHFVTRMISKKKEIELLTKNEKKLNVTYDQLIAEMSFKMAPVIISSDITLSLYNEYYKIVKARDNAQKAANLKHGTRRSNR